MKTAIIAFAVASSCLAGTTDDAIPDAAYLRYADGFRPYTLEVRVVEPSGQLAVSSAVAIGGRWALTAAHVVDDAATATVAGNPVRVSFIHPEYRRNEFGRFDIAMLRLRDDLGLDYYPPLSTGQENVGDVVSLAGYGVTGRLSAGYDRTDGRLRAGTNRIVRFEKTLLVCPARRGGSPLPMCIAPGDSGGPVFVGAGRDAVLAGIASFTMKDKGPLRSREGEEMGATRVSLCREWIDSVKEMVP